MKKSEAVSLEMQGTDLAPLTHEEICLICRLRAMRASARRMICDLAVEYAREFPDPEAVTLPN